MINSVQFNFIRLASLQGLSSTQQNESKLLKGQGHVTVNKPVISIIYIVAHTWPLCPTQILVAGVNPQESYFQKFTNISAIIQHTSISVVFLRSTTVHLQSNIFISRKVVKNHCDMAYQKY